jgi:hypothetical protein
MKSRRVECVSTWKECGGGLGLGIMRRKKAAEKCLSEFNKESTACFEQGAQESKEQV